MSIEKFQKLVSTVVPLPIENVDTDQIIPARFLKAVERKGFGDNLFRDWRYKKDGTPNPDFVLNNPRYSVRFWLPERISVADPVANMLPGRFMMQDSGSSFQAFLPIFSKAMYWITDFLPVQVPEAFLDEIFKIVETDPGAQFEVDLESQTITILEAGISVNFDINPYKKECLLNGYDDIDFLLSLKKEIIAFEQTQ